MDEQAGRSADGPGVVTLNRHGRTSNELNEYSKAFVDYLSPENGPALDIGSAFGVATIPALATGAAVIAVDIEPAHLRILAERTPVGDRHRLTTIAGSFPDEIRLEASSLGVIHAANLLHFLTGDAIERGVGLFYRWLRPGGKVFTISGTPYAGNIRGFIPVYARRKEAGERWPGEVNDLGRYSRHPTVQELPDFLHLLDDEVLARTFREAGFRIDRCAMFLRENLPDYLSYDGRENVGLIATKPITRKPDDRSSGLQGR